jgi:hypothetical protein
MIYLLDWVGNHPFLTVILLVIIFSGAIDVARAVFRK